jgi:hypothetical protein
MMPSTREMAPKGVTVVDPQGAERLSNAKELKDRHQCNSAYEVVSPADKWLWTDDHLAVHMAVVFEVLPRVAYSLLVFNI